jgi:DNA-binding winged helix-turn-helix (wHTH) protein
VIGHQNKEQASLRAGHTLWNPTTRQITLRGSVLKLPRRAEECFGILAEARGALVTKEELQNRIWGGALREESSLAHAIATLRKAIDPPPSGLSYIDTVARHGYRIAVPVYEEPAPEPAPPSPPPARKTGLWIAAALLALAASAFWIERSQRRQEAEAKVLDALSMLRLARPEEAARARILLESAVQFSPDLPIALAASAELDARYGKPPFDQTIALARRAAADPQCAECRAILGYILMTREWNWKEAGVHLRAANAREPVSIQWRLWYGQWLSIAGSLTEAEQVARAAIAQNPSRPQARTLLASVLFLQDRPAEAFHEGVAATTADNLHMAGHQWLTRILFRLNRDEEALRHRLKALLIWDPNNANHHNEYNIRLASALKTGGRPAVVKLLLDEVSVPPALDAHRYHRATWKAWIGDDEGALEELKAGAVSKPFHMIYTARDPVFAPLRSRPEFREIVRQLGLEDALPPQ